MAFSWIYKVWIDFLIWKRLESFHFFFNKEKNQKKILLTSIIYFFLFFIYFFFFIYFILSILYRYRTYSRYINYIIILYINYIKKKKIKKRKKFLKETSQIILLKYCGNIKVIRLLKKNIYYFIAKKIQCNDKRNWL